MTDQRLLPKTLHPHARDPPDQTTPPKHYSPSQTRRPRLPRQLDSPTQNWSGGPGFEPGASRSRTGAVACPSVSRRVLRCPPVLNRQTPRVLSCPPVSAEFRESVTGL